MKKVDIVNSQNKFEMEFRVGDGKTALDAESARKALEESLRRIPDTALAGLKSFRITALM